MTHCTLYYIDRLTQYFCNAAVNNILDKWSSQSTLVVEGELLYGHSELMKKEIKASMRALLRIKYEQFNIRGSVYAGWTV